MSEATDTSSAFNWGGLLSEVIKEGAPLLKASIDKPISNATQTQPTNQTTPPGSVAASVAVANPSPKNPMQYAPYLIGGGVLILGIFLVVVLKSAKS